jgi:hypothetical protein
MLVQLSLIIGKIFDCEEIKDFWGRCYDHNFRRFLPNFGENIGVFLKKQCYDQFFAKSSISLSKKANIFAKFFGENV